MRRPARVAPPRARPRGPVPLTVRARHGHQKREWKYTHTRTGRAGIAAIVLTGVLIAVGWGFALSAAHAAAVGHLTAMFLIVVPAMAYQYTAVECASDQIADHRRNAYVLYADMMPAWQKMMFIAIAVLAIVFGAMGAGELHNVTPRLEGVVLEHIAGGCIDLAILVAVMYFITPVIIHFFCGRK